MIIDGAAIAARVRADVARRVEELVRRGRVRPGLATILIGDDPASAVYVANKRRACREAGIETFHHDLPVDVAVTEVEALIASLNADPRVSGVLCQLPLPAHLDGVSLTGLIDPGKDVDGLTTASAGRLALGLDGLRPCTPVGVMEILRDSGIPISGAHAVVVGRSNLFGKPMGQLLLAADATVTMAHSRTADLPGLCATADLLIVAVGRARMVQEHWIKPGATVIDVGINRTDEGLQGDVDFDAARRRAGALTPVPGGVGPMTIAMLLYNTVVAAEGARVR